MLTIEYLKSLLEANSNREITSNVWSYDNRIFVTNGIAMLIIDSNLVNCDNLIKPIDMSDRPEKALISDIFSYPYDSIQSFHTTIDLQHFKQFLGEPEYPIKCNCDKDNIKCKECNGRGVIICDLGEEHDCIECQENYCDKCDSDGWIKPIPRYISVFDIVINGNALAQYLTELQDKNIHFSCNGESPVKLTGNGWDVYINPVRIRDNITEIRIYQLPFDNIGWGIYEK